MADYNYDESGNMATFFLLTFLLVVLIPLTLSSPAALRQKQSKEGCDCQECVAHREQLKEGFFSPKVRRRTFFLAAGWSLFGYLAYRAMTAKLDNKVYNPFEILDIKTGTSIKDIKSHYKKLSRKFHPDKVKLAANETMEAVEARFVEITKAYKALTDETIKSNWEKYGHPDGRQEISMGIALPVGIVKGRNRMFVLAGYGLVFGAMLPALVGRWWFGNREKTKDGVSAQSAAAYFKTLGEDSGIEDVVGSLGKSFGWERSKFKAHFAADIDALDKSIKEKLGETKWDSLKKLAEVMPGEHAARRQAFVLLYAHLLRIPVTNAALRKEQSEILLQTPTLLNALLNIVLSRNWLVPTLAAMRLHAYLAQALVPGDDSLKFAQLPGIKTDEARDFAKEAELLDELIESLKSKSDSRVQEVKKVAQKWGKLDLVDASFKVIGERVILPLSIVYLVVKLRIKPSTSDASTEPEKKGASTPADEEAEEEFLMSKDEASELPSGKAVTGWAHAPRWPANRKPSWWLVLADCKLNRIVVPPLKITDVPLADPTKPHDYRAYKLQFQAPQNIQSFNWKVFLVSDTFVGEEVSRDITLSISDPAVVEKQELEEDEISDPEEDTLAGQMALMRGGSVKKRDENDDSDDDSSTDDDKSEKGGDDSSSDDDD